MQVPPPDMVSDGGVIVNETEPVYQLFNPLGELGERTTAGAPGAVVSILTVAVAVLVSPLLSVAVQLML